MALCIGGDKFREAESDVITKQRLRTAEQEKDAFSPAFKSNADINKTEHKPLGHTTVKSARRKKAEREKQEKKHGDRRGSSVNAGLPDAEFYNGCYTYKACRQDQKIDKIPAHGKDNNQRDHTNARNDAEHTLFQADSVIRDRFDPFFKHLVFPPVFYDKDKLSIFQDVSCSPAMCSHTLS